MNTRRHTQAGCNSSLRLADRWAPVLLSQPEAGMGYQVVRLTLRDGRQLDGVSVVGGVATGLPPDVATTLTDDDIASIEVMHAKSND